MQDFDLYLPTHIVFGKGRVAELGKLTTGRGERVLITYGGGSVIKSGLLDAVKAQLANRTVFTFGGIEPNPKIGTIKKAIELCREEISTSSWPWAAEASLTPPSASRPALSTRVTPGI